LNILGQFWEKAAIPRFEGEFKQHFTQLILGEFAVVGFAKTAIPSLGNIVFE
jgi:hypothetical protein